MNEPSNTKQKPSDSKQSSFNSESKPRSWSLSSHGSSSSSSSRSSFQIENFTAAEEKKAPEIDVVKLATLQRKKFETIPRAKSPPHEIPISCMVPDQTLAPHKVAWLKTQQQKANDVIYDERFEDAKKMVEDGRAHILASNGYNMYGEKLNDGMNFFDKPLDEDYEMLDWLPTWVRRSRPPLYYEVRRA